MAAQRLAEMTYTEVQALPPARVVAILPVGATEAHGPHLPLSTDVIISEAMAEAAAARLQGRGLTPILLPPLAYSVADMAAEFAGTVSITAATATALLLDVGRRIHGWGWPVLALANSHLDPAHLRALHAAAQALEQEGLAVAFPDLTRKPWAPMLTAEFRSGACHAGSFEGSVVMATRPDLVREDVRVRLPANPASLSRAIRAGLTTFREAGGAQAYFGDPAAASGAEGAETMARLGGILEHAVMERLGAAA